MSRLNRTMLLLAALCALAAPARAQAPVWALFKQVLAGSMDPKQVAYNYRLTVKSGSVGTASTRVLDGKMIVQGLDYMDSNTARIAVCRDDYFVEVDHENKEVTVSNYKQLARKLKISKTPGLTDVLPDSVIIKYGRLRFDTLSARGMATLHIDLSAAQIFLENISIDVDRSSMAVRRIAYNYSQPDGDGEDMHYSCTLYNIGKPVAGVPAIEGFVDIRHAANPVPAPKYAGYKIKKVN